MSKPGPLLVIIGETASGKSALALTLAKKFDGELISADSWTVYKGFDVGTAKPSAEEQAEVPHHLLDVADPADGFSAVLFQKLAKQAIEDITARGKLPILVGGTGLYVDSVLYDYGFLPPSDPALREELNALDLPAVLARAEEMGLDTTGIDLGNKRRLIRLIENKGERPTMLDLRENTLVLGLQTPAELLLQKIQRRVDLMLDNNLEFEVRALSEKYGWDVEPMKGIGYKEWRSFISGHSSKQARLADTRQQIIKHTLDLAKRQRTWFKRNKSIHWLTTEDKLAEAVDFTTTFLNK